MSERFSFASGCRHCEWVWLGCVVVESGTTRVGCNSVPAPQCLQKLSQCKILDSWYTTGLCDTGSNDLLVDGVLVEAEHTISFQDVAPVKRPGPLYAFPLMFAAKASAPALGDARHPIGALIDTASQEPARRYTLGERPEAPKTTRYDAFVQEAVGRAEAMLASARLSVRGHRRSVDNFGRRQPTTSSRLFLARRKAIA